MPCNYAPSPYIPSSNALRAPPPGNLSISGWVGEGLWCADERLSGSSSFLNEDCVVFFRFSSCGWFYAPLPPTPPLSSPLCGVSGLHLTRALGLLSSPGPVTQQQQLTHCISREQSPVVSASFLGILPLGDGQFQPLLPEASQGLHLCLPKLQGKALSGPCPQRTLMLALKMILSNSLRLREGTQYPHSHTATWHEVRAEARHPGC